MKKGMTMRAVRLGVASLMVSLTAAGFAGLVCANAAHAEVAAADPIDAAMRACLARADRSSTAGQVQCMDEARNAWRAAADAALGRVIAKLPPAQQKRWQLSQKTWASWRDIEDAMLAAAFATTSGSSYQLYAADMRLQPVRDRALALRSVVAAAAGADAPRARPCSDDALCEHATYDLERYYRKLYARMPAHARPVLARAQAAWRTYRDATTPLMDERARLDLLGARLATLKRLSETVGNR